MTDFVDNWTGLSTTKADLVTVPVGADPNNYLTAAEVNTGNQDLLDLRARVLPTYNLRYFGGIPNSSGAASGNATAMANAIAQAHSIGGARIILVPGKWYFNATIDVLSRYSVVLEGGQGASGSFDSVATEIIWTGASNGTVVRVKNSDSCQVRHLLIDGNSLAGIGLEVSSSAACRNGLFDDILIRGVSGSPGRSIYRGSATNTQCDNHLFRRIWIQNGPVGVYQDGAQTINCIDEGPYLISHSGVGMDFVSGDCTTRNINFESAGGGMVADIRVGAGAYWARFYGNYHELLGGSSGSGYAYSFPTSTARNFATVISGARVLLNQGGTPAGGFVSYNQTGPVVTEGCTWQLFDPATDEGVVLWNGQSGGQPACVTEIAAQYANGAVAQWSGNTNYNQIGTTSPAVPAVNVAGTYNSGVTNASVTQGLTGICDRMVFRENMRLYHSRLYLSNSSGSSGAERGMYLQSVFGDIEGRRISDDKEIFSFGESGQLGMWGTDASGTPGNVTLDRACGIVAIAIGAATVQVTNATVGTGSIVLTTLKTVDATATQILSTTTLSGSFTVTVNAAATAATKIGFVVINPLTA